MTGNPALQGPATNKFFTFDRGPHNNLRITT